MPRGAKMCRRIAGKAKSSPLPGARDKKLPGRPARTQEPPIASCGAVPHIFPGRNNPTRVFVAQDELPDPFGESHLVATLPSSNSALGLKGAALLIALAILLLVVRGLVG